MAKRAKAPRLHWRDTEDLEWFAAKGIDLIQHSPLGEQLEKLRDHVGLMFGIPSTEAGWAIDFHEHTDSAKARRIAMRLQAAGTIEPGASSVLFAYHHPIAVGLDGVTFGEKGEEVKTYQHRLDLGRLLALYPGTATALDARSWTGKRLDRERATAIERAMTRLCGARLRPVRQDPRDRVGPAVSRGGKSPYDAFKQMAEAKTTAKGAEADIWREIDREARVLLDGAVAAWVSSADSDDGSDMDRKGLAAEFGRLVAEVTGGA